MPFTVRLGNPAPVNSTREQDGTVTVTPAQVTGEQVTVVEVPHDDPMDALTEITSADGVMGFHFADGVSPTWVECEQFPPLAQLLAARYGIPVKTAEQAQAAVAEATGSPSDAAAVDTTSTADAAQEA